MTSELHTKWSFARMSRALLALAIVAPVAGVTYGSARGTPLDQLGGVMVAYWMFSLASLVAAVLDRERRSRAVGSDRWLLLVGLALVAPPFVKVLALLLVEPTGPKIGTPVHSTLTEPGASSEDYRPKLDCRPNLVSDSAPVLYSKNGRSGQIGWYLWVGNRYIWQLKVSIAANANGAAGTASATGTTSSWYSVINHPRSVTAAGKGSVDCIRTASDCICSAGVTGDTGNDQDFMASVDVQSTETRAGVQLKVVSSAGVSGTVALSGVKAGVNGAGGTIGLDLQSPNTARDATTKSKSYSYSCVGSL
jgi:hypothetical protein